jgi:hypothetical protein
MVAEVLATLQDDILRPAVSWKRSSSHWRSLRLRGSAPAGGDSKPN